MTSAWRGTDQISGNGRYIPLTKVWYELLLLRISSRTVQPKFLFYAILDGFLI